MCIRDRPTECSGRSGGIVRRPSDLLGWEATPSGMSPMGGFALNQVSVGEASTPGKEIRSLVARMPEKINSVEEAPEWEELDMAMDSGATESVVNEDMITNIETVEGEAFKMGVQYEVASGTMIPNLGEKKFVAVNEAGVARKMTAQVCDVNKALLSVHRVVQAGNTVVFSKNGSYIEDNETYEKIPLREAGGMYMLKLWVKKVFPGQGSNP